MDDLSSGRPLRQGDCVTFVTAGTSTVASWFAKVSQFGIIVSLLACVGLASHVPWAGVAVLVAAVAASRLPTLSALWGVPRLNTD